MAKKKERGSFTKLLIIIAVVMLAIVVKISYDRIIVARSFPLHKAIVAGNTEKIDKFSQEPEHINEETAKAGDLEKYPPRTSPLDIAIDQGNLDLVKLLLERGAEAATDNLDNAIYDTPLTIEFTFDASAGIKKIKFEPEIDPEKEIYSVTNNRLQINIIPDGQKYTMTLYN